jgi:ribosomal protein S12 methylthiotransferase
MEGTHEESDLLLTGRTAFQAPEVDGIVIVNDTSQELADLLPGSFCDVEITGSAGYDLLGTAL